MVLNPIIEDTLWYIVTLVDDHTDGLNEEDKQALYSELEEEVGLDHCCDLDSFKEALGITLEGYGVSEDSLTSILSFTNEKIHLMELGALLEYEKHL